MDYLKTALEDIHKEALAYFNEKERKFLKYDIVVDGFIETYERQINYLCEKFFEQKECKLHYYNYLEKDYYTITTLGGYKDFLYHFGNRELSDNLSFNTFDEVLTYMNKSKENKDRIYNITKRWYLNTIGVYNLREELINNYARYVYGLQGNWFKLLFLSRGHKWYIEDIEYGVTYQNHFGEKSNKRFTYFSDAKKEFKKLVRIAKEEEWVEEMASGRVCSGVEIRENGYEVSRNGREYNAIDEVVGGMLNDYPYRGINSGDTYFHAYTEIAKRFINIDINTYRTTKLKIGYEK